MVWQREKHLSCFLLQKGKLEPLSFKKGSRKLGHLETMLLLIEHMVRKQRCYSKS